MSLSTLLVNRRHSAAASLWSVRNPCVIRADSEPPGRRPPAPGSQHPSVLPVTGGTFASSGVVGVSSALADSRPIALVLAESQAYDVCLIALPGVADAVATRRQAKVCLRPLSFYGKDRASRPPPLQHRVLIRAASSCLRRLSTDVSLPGLLRNLFCHRSGASWIEAVKPHFADASHFSLTAPWTYV
jgi:hypothetical protein